MKQRVFPCSCRARTLALATFAACASACAGASATTGSPNTLPGTTTPADTLATTRQALGGRGSLRQETIALRLQLQGVLARMFPLDEPVIELLAPDSWRSMRGLLDSQKDRIERARVTSQAQRFSIWYVSFHALEPDARFSPSAVVISSAGRDYRPEEIIPLSAGFGEQRIQQGQSQTALYLFDAALDVSQPLEVSIEGVRNAGWTAILRELERERTRLRAGRIDTAAVKARSSANN